MSAPLAERVHDLWHAARAAWPGVDLGADEFARHVLSKAPDAAGVDALNSADLYLACACAMHAPGALETFERVLLAQVPRMVAQLDPLGQLGDEVRQALRERLLVARGGAPPSISTYHGRGTLLAWLRVSASRVAYDLLNERSGRREVALDDGAQLGAAGGDLELELIKLSYRREFEEAIRAALLGLPQRERNLLRLHLLGGVSTHKLGAMFHVDQSTIVRWIAAARQSVRDAACARLSERLRVSASELESLAPLMLSRIDVSLAGCLGDAE